MPLYQFPAAIRHPSTPRAPDLQLRMTPKEMQRDPEIERPRQVEQVVQDDRYRNDQSLRGLRAIDASEDIDAVRTKRGEERHVQVIEGSEIDECSEEPAER